MLNIKNKKMAGNTNHISVITLNINGLNSSIKRHRLEDWIKKQDPTRCCLQETHLIGKDIHRLKVKGCPSDKAKVNYKGQRRTFHTA